MKKLLKTLKNRQGATLMELIVGMAVSTIIAASITAVMSPMLVVFMQANDLAELNSLLDTLSEYMMDDISRASDISVSGNLTIRTNADVIIYSVNSEGVLLRGGIPVLEKGYYKGKSVKVEYLNESEVAISGDITDPFYVVLTVSSDRSTRDLGSRKYAANPLSFKQH